MGIDTLDNFPIQFQNEAQHAVGGGMLRAEVDVEIADIVFGHCDFFSAPASWFGKP